MRGPAAKTAFLLLPPLLLAAAAAAFGPAPSRPRRSPGAASSSLFSSRSFEPERDPGASEPFRLVRKYEVEAAMPPPLTEAASARILAPSLPSRPKIVVLGATGGVGRRVVRSILATGADLTVVAVVRSYDRALETLFDVGDDAEGGSVVVERGRKRRGPRLEIAVSDLVDRDGVYGRGGEDEDDEIELEFNSTTLASVRRYYGDAEAERVYSASSANEGDRPDHIEVLSDAVKDCTAIISCVGTVRPTNLWTDYVRNPLRIFQKDASRWCSDPRHPFYVNYVTTRDALELAEAEQRRRDAEIERFQMAEEEMAREAAKMGRSYVPTEADGWSPGVAGDDEIRRGADKEKRRMADRIKFVRISDLAVSIPPWSTVSLLTNLGRSLVFRDQERAELLLEESAVVDTITLRPGDLVDEQRNATTTSLQVCSSGELPYPAIVSREDVAGLAVAAALTGRDGGTHGNLKDDRHYETDVAGKAVKKRKRRRKDANEPASGGRRKAVHYTWAVRWAGAHLEQGKKGDGLPDGQSCADHLFRLERKRAARRKRSEDDFLRESDALDRLLARVSKPLRKRRLKPYGVCVAVPVYLVLTGIFLSALRNVPGKDVAVGFIVRKFTKMA